MEECRLPRGAVVESPRLRFIEGKPVRDRYHYGSSPFVSAMRRISNAMRCLRRARVACEADVIAMLTVMLRSNHMKENSHVGFFGGCIPGRERGYPLLSYLMSCIHFPHSWNAQGRAPRLANMARVHLVHRPDIDLVDFLSIFHLKPGCLEQTVM